MRERLREVADQPPASGSYSSESRPTSLREAEQALEERLGLVAGGPAARRLSASQNVHGRNAPSPGGSPSTGLASSVR